MTEQDLIPTDDGSMTCYNQATGELYHNRAGAYSEALVNYAEPSHFMHKLDEHSSLTLLDVCFGLGYNTWVLLEKLIEYHHKPFTVTVYCLEKDREILKHIPAILDDQKFYHLKKYFDPKEHNIYYQTQSGVAELTIAVAEKSQIILKFFIDDLRQVIPKLEDDFDLVFHDPFSPVKVPELWTCDLFSEYFRLLKNRQGRLLTYSSAGAVRGGLREAGFHLYRSSALGAKTGGTVASVRKLDFFKPQFVREQCVYQLAPEESSFLETRSSVPYRDPTFSADFESVVTARMQELQDSNLPAAGRERILYIP